MRKSHFPKDRGNNKTILEYSKLNSMLNHYQQRKSCNSSHQTVLFYALILDDLVVRLCHPLKQKASRFQRNDSTKKHLLRPGHKAL